MSIVDIFPDMSALTRAAAEYFVTLAGETLATHSRFTVALSGGETPRALYARLASPAVASRVDWSRVFVFWGDERCVPPDDVASNYRMAYETWLAHVPIPIENIHRIPGELRPGDAASAYEDDLRAFFAPEATSGPTRGLPRFDLVWLGMGADGHTASLFPGSSALSERRRWVTATHVESLNEWRVTLTPMALNAAAHLVFLVVGESKAERLLQVLTGPPDPLVLPAHVIHPTDGDVRWMVDTTAASRFPA